jgi:outer membrane lipoprotein
MKERREAMSTMHSRMRQWVVLLAIATMLHWAGCSSSAVIPDSLEPQIDKNLTFDQVVESPDSYRGRTFVVGGEVLGARRQKDGTQLEILQLPLDSDYRPVGQRTQSKGRLLALDPLSSDPATLPDGTPVTMVAEVTGVKTDKLDESEYRYPTLSVKHLHVWQGRPDPYGRRAGPAVGVFGGGVFGFGGGGGTRSGGGISIGTGF